MSSSIDTILQDLVRFRERAKKNLKVWVKVISIVHYLVYFDSFLLHIR